MNYSAQEIGELESKWWEHLVGNDQLRKEMDCKYREYQEWIEKYNLYFDSEKYI